MTATSFASIMGMATLHVRGVPDELYRRLKRRARDRHSSITAEAIRLLDRGLDFERPGQERLIDAIRREREPVRTGAPSAAELIREDRER